jgi:hypothetical protein
MINDYMSLSTRRGFNKSLGHFRLVTGIVQQMNEGQNLAEIVDELEKAKEVEKSQIGPILNAIVVDRMGYSTLSFNLPQDTSKFEDVWAETQRWGKLDIIVAYHHPQLGVSLLNPKQKSHWEAIREFNREELVVLYLKALDEADRALEPEALAALRDLLTGRTPPDTSKFAGPAPRKAAPAPPPKPAAAPAAAPRPAPASAPAAAAPAVSAAPEPAAETPAASAPPAAPAEGGGKKKVTPKYSIQVTNELFHNGNVEAWKNIVESYKAKYPGLEVHIFHDGQKVNNINALFKWGKVKHGDAILFAVSGDDIKGVAKLQRYLFEGASLRYTNFLKKDVNKILNLF